jgi:hypothetical protein
VSAVTEGKLNYIEQMNAHTGPRYAVSSSGRTIDWLASVENSFFDLVDSIMQSAMTKHGPG